MRHAQLQQEWRRESYLVCSLLLIETPPGLYCKQGVPFTGVIALVPGVLLGVLGCTQVFELVWPAVRAVLRGAAVSAFREESCCSRVALATCKRLHIQTECHGGSVHVAQGETVWICPQSRGESYLLNHHVVFILCLSN